MMKNLEIEMMNTIQRKRTKKEMETEALREKVMKRMMKKRSWRKTKITSMILCQERKS